MARKAEWLVRLPSALERLRAADFVAIPAGTLAELLKINLRRAQQICQPFASAEYGGMAERRRLIAGLEVIASGEAGAAEAERKRLARMREFIAEAAKDLPLHQIQIAAAARGKTLRETKVDDLPERIRLGVRHAEFDYETEEEFIEQMTKVAFARINDHARFIEAVEGVQVQIIAPSETPGEFTYTPGAEPVWQVTMDVQ
jgi:RNA-binding protein YlmH